VKADIYKDFGDIIKKANCNYLVIDNAGADIPLITINGRWYSLIENENTNFMDVYFNGKPFKTDEEVKAEKEAKEAEKKATSSEKIDLNEVGPGFVSEEMNSDTEEEIKLTSEQAAFRDGVLKDAVKPVEEGFSDRLREAYDRFIDAVLAYYPPERIILIRYRAQRFTLSYGSIEKNLNDINTEKFIAKIDDYFCERVKCHVIDTENIYAVPEDRNNMKYDDINTVYGVERDILTVIGTAPKPIYDRKPHSLKSAITVYDSLSEYIRDYGSNKEIIKEFIEKGTLSCDDIVSLIYRFNKDDDKVFLDEIAAMILANKNSYPYLFTKNTFTKNVEFLSQYEYNNIDITAEFDDKIIVKISPKEFVVVDKNGLSRMKNGADYISFRAKNFYKANFHCTLKDIYLALESWEMYFERGRNKCTDPFVLEFKDIDEFYDSLYYIDYKEIMANENYYLKLAEKPLKVSESYAPKINFDFFFDKRNRFVYQGGGFAERMFYLGYHAVRVFKKELDNVYFYDFGTSREPEIMHDTNNISYAVPEKYHSHFLRHSLNGRLINRFYNSIEVYSEKDWHKSSAFALYKLGLKEFVAYSNYQTAKIFLKYRDINDFECPQSLFSSRELLLVEKRLSVDMDDTVNMFFSYCRRYRDTVNEQKADFEKIFEFPPFEEDNNKIVAEKMLACNAVSVHIRRGDFFTAYTVEKARRENSYYKEQLERVWRIPGYDNKHLFVFSDDLDFCREHFDELGLGIAGDNITYVEGNDHFESWRDMQLMSLGKIIVISQSGFCQCAALVSKRVEYILGEGTGTYDLLLRNQTLWHRGYPDEIVGYETPEAIEARKKKEAEEKAKHEKRLKIFGGDL
jgi:hypothetical protein